MTSPPISEHDIPMRWSCQSVKPNSGWWGTKSRAFGYGEGRCDNLPSPPSAGKIPAMLNELWDSDARRLKKLRDKLQAMTDQQLLDYGRDCGEMCADKYMRVSFEPDPWLEKLREARTEWRRRHPKR